MKDMKDAELEQLEGGVAWFIPLIVGAMIGTVVNGWSDFKDGYSEAYAREMKAL